ncbi:KilA-N domain-containing protein [Escherichia coli]|uniref:KilA-N domain-containing protein n=1 Tax=Escherichia coli TaxID=562 RepID=UPI0017CDF7A8|nr:KilA-N domain-containing protein [Escherichia coli]EFA7759216.1 KilA-N domain-containing protein [Escherichia coli]EFA7784341.1 KilA-N domain-containing protein [Escherichia coli]EFA7789724.1 KilA-N domain-containing protein [Escherichia coli]EFA7794770.1 KilA-N domain-containing protein [Escherichia coli]
MKYPTVIVNGVSVRVDEDGRYNLNDLHAAAVANGEATEQQRPSQFLRSAQIKRFIKALKAKVQKCTLEQNQPLKVVNGTDEPGIWAVELLAIRYAAWIKPEFEIEVYEVFRTAVRLGIGAMVRLNKIDHIIDTETKEISQCASKMARWGTGGRKQLLYSARERAVDELQMYLPGIK